MFDILFGWSKASKCKRLIKRARCRLKLLKNKREAIAKQLRKDLAELIHSGHEETALNRVEQLIEDEILAAAYELLDNYCEFILTQLSYIRRHKDFPNDINEAVSSLIFASARCGEIPELCVIRKLFGERYGQNFVTTALELFPGNLVNKQLIENLSGNKVSDDVKYKMIDEIVRDNCPQQNVLAIQFYPDWQQEQVKENKGHNAPNPINDTISGSKVHPSSEIEEIKREVTSVNSSIISKPSDSCSSPKSTLVDVFAMVSTVQQYPPYILNCPLQKEKVSNSHDLLSYKASNLQNKVERMALPSSAEKASSPPQEEIEEYFDEIDKDQMLFKFRTSMISRREKNQQFGSDASDDTDQDESASEKSSTRASSTRSKRAHEKRSRRRSSSLESIGRMDTGYMIYYHNHRSRKHQKPSLGGIPQSGYSQKRLKQQSFSEKEQILQQHQNEEDGTRRKSFNIRMNRCSINKPCYFCHNDDEEEGLEDLSVKPKRLIKSTHHVHQLLLDELNQGLELVAIPQRPTRKSYNDDYNADQGKNEMGEAESSASNSRSFSSSLKRIETETPYSRAMTMPQERRSKNTDKNMLRTYSCPSEHPNHVHPKLPDYDDLAAKFSALKRECREKRLQ